MENKGTSKRKKIKTIIQTPSFQVYQMGQTTLAHKPRSIHYKAYLSTHDHPSQKKKEKTKETESALIAKHPNAASSASAKQISTTPSFLITLQIRVLRLTPLLIGGVPTFPDVDLVAAATLGRLEPAPAPPIDVRLVPPPLDAVEDTVELRLR